MRHQIVQTPCYIIDKQVLDKNYDELTRAFAASWPRTIVGFSVKTNPLPWLLSYAQSKGCYAEVVSDHEYDLALAQGYRDDRIIFNGPVKGRGHFLRAIERKAIVNIDSENEIEWLAEYGPSSTTHVGVRVSIDLNSLVPGESRTGDDGGRFGFCYENGELERAVRRIEAVGNCYVSGLHLHINSKERSAEVFRHLARYACMLKNALDLDLAYVDIGGGFYGGHPHCDAYYEYAACIAEELGQSFDPERTELIVEPGGAVLATPISFKATVLDAKPIRDHRIVVTEASRVWLDPTMSKSSYALEIDFDGERSSAHRQVICGYTCMDSDRLFELTDYPELKRGDVITFRNVGAYTYSFNPAFFIETRPAFYVDDDGELLLVKNRDNINSIIGD